MNPDKKKNISSVLYIIARGVAVVSGIFAMVLVILLVANYLQTQAVDPLNSKALTHLMERLQENPADNELKEQIRALDLLARKAYFTHHWQMRNGNILLFCCGLLLVGSLKYMSSLKRELPDLAEKADPDNSLMHNILARKYIIYGGLAVFIAALSFGIMSEKSAKSIEFGTESNPEPTPTLAAVDLSAFKSIRKNWPGLRGPEGKGIAYEANPIIKWDAITGENILWKMPLPLPGFNSPIVQSGKVFLSGGDRNSKEVYCFEAASGKMLWKGELNDVAGSPADMAAPSGDTGYAAASMAADSMRVFAIFATGDIACWDLNGTRLWAKNIGKPDNHYGHSSSLITYQGLLFVQFDQNSGGHLIALQAADGQQVYDISRDTGISWASPILVNTGARAELILNSNPAVISYEPATGRELWRVDCMTGEVAPSLAYADGRVYAVNDYASLVCLKIGNPAERVWEFEDDLSEVSSPVATESFLIVPTSWGTVSCFNSKTGERYWSHDFEEGFYSSPIIAGELVFLADMPGTFYVFKAAEEFELISTCKMGERILATPAFMYGRIYIRGDKHLFCIGNKE